MRFIETRGNDGRKPTSVSFSEAILNPSASYGGLYLPETLPPLGEAFLREHLNSDYATLAKAVLRSFEIDIPESLLDDALARYRRFDDADKPVPVVRLDDDTFVCELYHGPTRAFKDMALQPFGAILAGLAEQRGEHYLILAATSGDTGPAALSTFENAPGVQVACLYPSGGTSDVQRLQMVTMGGDNLCVLGIHGNFDDAQNTLKRLLGSESFHQTLADKHIKLSAANSVNFGRIIFQIVYHIHAYLELVRQGRIAMGDPIQEAIPSGNFGNALGAFYARKMGLPLARILIASNANNVLTDLIRDGAYDLRGRSLVNTNSPAMDILKSSNVERVLFDFFGAERTRELMAELDTQHGYRLSDAETAQLQEVFAASYSSDEEVAAVIREYAARGYIMDGHTATCIKAIREAGDAGMPTVVASTAEWTKFSPMVHQAIHGGEPLHDDEALKRLSEEYGLAVTPHIAGIFNDPVRHPKVIEKADIEREIVVFLGR